jgi:hypothetical protein
LSSAVFAYVDDLVELNRRGRDDFFFCHWIAESEDDILELLDKTCVSNTIVTMANEMHRFITTYDIKDEKIIMHDEM